MSEKKGGAGTFVFHAVQQQTVFDKKGKPTTYAIQEHVEQVGKKVKHTVKMYKGKKEATLEITPKTRPVAVQKKLVAFFGDKKK